MATFLMRIGFNLAADLPFTLPAKAQGQAWAIYETSFGSWKRPSASKRCSAGLSIAGRRLSLRGANAV